MKTYFISADIEGITDVTEWCETKPGGEGYEQARLQMTRETAAACEAILAAGHRVVVRDGHGNARNLIHDLLPRKTELMRGWAGHPGSMMAGVTKDCAGIFYIGYHAPGGVPDYPLAHTIHRRLYRWIRINGRLASEFTLNSLYGAWRGVPSLFISGDEVICRMAAEEMPGICTVPVKRGRGHSTWNCHPAEVCARIRQEAAAALNQAMPLRSLPGKLEAEVLLAPETGQTEKLRFTASNPEELNLCLDRIADRFPELTADG